MKNFFIAMMVLVLGVISFATLATNRTHNVGEYSEGKYIQVAGDAEDTIVLNDTVSYVFQISHANVVAPELETYYDKVGSGNPTVKLDIYESFDESVWVTVKKGKAQAAYTKTYSPTADGILECSFLKDTAYFNKRFIKYQYSTGNTSGTKAKLTLRHKTNITNIR